MLEKYLQEIGLSDKEATVYIALLQVDNDSVLDLSRKTKINRTTIYPVLDSLSKKGLINEVKIDNKVRFQAQPPERLETYVERQKVTLEESAKRLHGDIVPQLKSIQREEGERPVVKYFEGREGVISSMEELFETPITEKMQYTIYSRDIVDKLFSDAERKRFVNIRLDKDVTSKAIYTHTRGDLPQGPRNVRARIDEKKYPISCDISIYQDKVKINILGEKLSGISIVSKDLAQTMKSLVNCIFDLKEEVSKLKGGKES